MKVITKRDGKYFWIAIKLDSGIFQSILFNIRSKNIKLAGCLIDKDQPTLISWKKMALERIQEIKEGIA